MKINNWDKHQSYKDRRPQWIRFHRSILDDYKYQSMTADSRALLPMLWLLACEDEDPTSGLIRVSIEEIMFRLRTSRKILIASLNELQVAGFIECNESVTNPLRNRSEIVTPETETETEKTIVPKGNLLFEEFWSFYPRKDSKKKSLLWWNKNVKNLEMAKLIISGLTQQLDIFKARERKHIPLPTTWLNGERWNDEVGSPDDNNIGEDGFQK